MKKISVLLIAFLLVASFAFAEETFSVAFAGNAGVTFGVDLEEGTTGFDNDIAAGLTITWVPDQRVSSDGSDWYGDIELRFAYRERRAATGGATATGTGDLNHVTVTRARITNDVVYISILAPSTSDDNVVDVFNETDEVIGVGFRALAFDDFAGTFGSELEDASPALALVQSNTAGGITIGYSEGAINDLSLAIVSDGDWTDNAENYYGIVLNADVTVDVITITNKLFLGVFADDVAYGNTTTVGLTLEDTGTSVGVAFDLEGSTAEGSELAWKASLTLGQELAEGTDVQVRTTLSPVGDDLGLDLGLTFVEGTADGLAPGIGAKLGVVLMQVLGVEDTMTLGVLFDVEYSEGGVNPFAGIGYHQVLAEGGASFLAYEAGVSLTADFHGIENTAFTLRYGNWDDGTQDSNTENLHTGFLTFETRISF